MIRYVRKGDVVVTTKLDRLARSVRDLLTIVDRIEEKGATLQILNLNIDTGNPNGRLMLTMLGGIAEWEREIMLERQAEGIQRAKAAGKYKGRKATARAKTDKVFELLDQGKSKAAIARELEIGTSSVFRILAAGRS